MTEVYGIIGYPVSHSLSPLMHNCAFKELKISAVYGCFEVKPEELKQAVEGIKALGIKGVSVTVPHKEKVMEFLDEIEETAREIGAVNTILNENGVLKGFNTDWIGVLKAFEVSGVEVKGKKVVIIGAGGASRAVVYAVKKAGAEAVEVYNRTFEKAVKLAKQFDIIPKKWEELKKAWGDIIIQTTSVGMNSWESPVEEEVIARFNTAMDIVYTPLKTKFLNLAEKYGIIIDGLKMLLYQGVEQFKIWIKKEPPVKLMEKTLYSALQERELWKGK